MTLWINSPKISEESKITADKNTVWLPDAARGTSIIGGAGSGKSFTVTIPTLRSAIAQGLSTMLLDTDYPGLTKTIAPLAEDLGYEVSIFAPGYKESAVCNVVDLIYNCRDATGASQVAKTLVKNFQMAATDASSTDAFFGPAGELATEAALLLAKALKYPDILTAYTILKDEDMISRVRGVSKIDPWLDLAFGQLLSTAKSERTVDSIRGTAALLFGQLMRPDILPSLVGKTTIPLDITGRKLIIFGVKQNIRLVVSPLIASVINALVSRNVLHGRKEPLFLSLDEMPSMYFPEIAEWLSEKRKYGLCTQIGYQSLGQLRKTYGKDQADVIYTNTATKFFFNPQSLESAKTFSETLGEQDVVYKTKNRTYGRPRTRTEHRTKKRLMTPDEFMNQAEGCCVLLSPGYGTKTERFIPVRFQPLKIADSELEIQKMVEESWETFLSEKERTGIGNKQVAPDEISKRIDDFQNRLPIIKSKTNASPLDMMLQDV
ncbi:type IV secretory system conjugative DNA transfer family protein [Synechococcus sp. PCC 7335]|uniref:type IV secretory system conjugative DNA transfer family protein n=1 Tax=Synechococcus sp. (strain ATCC 29403 / PCC 7335) TaxID=91464 RepID=UPI0018DDD205|nr:TraM recognition domain-containing protein [Synechococcus sp. PCC 7335]